MTPGPDGGGAPLVALRGITKRYGGLLANDGIDLAIGRGEVHALLGENGAGKSTLVKILYGVIEPTAGEIAWEGRPVRIGSPVEARRLGIGMVFQHFSLFDQLTVAENIAVALSGTASLKAMRRRLDEVSRGYGLGLEPDRAVWTLSAGERQRIEIVRCLLAGSEAHRPRRADLGAHPAGGRAALRDPRAACRRGPLDPLHLAQARGGAPPVPDRDRAAQRPGRRDARPARGERPRHRGPDGRRRGRRGEAPWRAGRPARRRSRCAA